MGLNSPVATAGDELALLLLLRTLRRELQRLQTTPYVNVGGAYRLSVDSAGNLVATHGPSGRTQIVMTPS